MSKTYWHKTATIAASLILAAAILAPILYRVVGVSLIEDAYFGRSFSFLNRIAALRDDHTLEEFYAAAESVLFEIVFVLVALAVILFAYAKYVSIASTDDDRHERYLARFDAAVFVVGILVSMSMECPCPIRKWGSVR